MPYHAPDAPDGRTETTSARTMDGPRDKVAFSFWQKLSRSDAGNIGGHLHQTSVVARLTSSLRAALLCMTGDSEVNEIAMRLRSP